MSKMRNHDIPGDKQPIEKEECLGRLSDPLAPAETVKHSYFLQTKIVVVQRVA